MTLTFKINKNILCILLGAAGLGYSLGGNLVMVLSMIVSLVIFGLDPSKKPDFKWKKIELTNIETYPPYNIPVLLTLANYSILVGYRTVSGYWVAITEDKDKKIEQKVTHYAPIVGPYE